MIDPLSVEFSLLLRFSMCSETYLFSSAAGNSGFLIFLKTGKAIVRLLCHGYFAKH